MISLVPIAVQKIDFPQKTEFRTAIRTRSLYTTINNTFLQQQTEARKPLTVPDGIQLSENTLPVINAKLFLEWENAILEKWHDWDESLWYSYEQTVRLLERKFHFVDLPSDKYMGTYFWLHP